MPHDRVQLAGGHGTCSPGCQDASLPL
jgi:hypothetical protein